MESLHMNESRAFFICTLNLTSNFCIRNTYGSRRDPYECDIGSSPSDRSPISRTFCRIPVPKVPDPTVSLTGKETMDVLPPCMFTGARFPRSKGQVCRVPHTRFVPSRLGFMFSLCPLVPIHRQTIVVDVTRGHFEVMDYSKHLLVCLQPFLLGLEDGRY